MMLWLFRGLSVACCLGGSLGVLHEWLDSRSLICTDCNGHGYTTQPRTAGPRWQFGGATCDRCGGAGYMLRSRALMLTFLAVALVGWWGMALWLVVP